MGEIEINESLPSLQVGFFHRHVKISSADIVDQDIDWSGFGQNAGAKCLAGFGIGHVSGKCPGLATPVADFGSGALESRQFPGIQHDIGTCFGCRQGDDPAKALAPASDK